MFTSTQKENQPAGNAIPAAVSPIRLQTKLAIGAVNDPLEHEAVAMADKVMSMQEVPSVAAAGAGDIQRKCAGCEEEENVQRKPLASFIQRKESSAGTVASDVVSNQINASKGNGSSIDIHTQSFMQNRFGTDFSDVKIHTGGEAIQMNRELNAKAFTVGNDIYFNEGQYNPNSNDGKYLLAHELTHTVQQGGVLSNLANDYNFVQRQSLGDFIPTDVRALTPAEISIAQGVYGNSIIYSMVLISNAIGMNNREYTLHTGNKITVIQMGPTAFNSPSPSTLIHELAHSWQCQHGITGYEYMTNSLASQALGGSGAYCYVSGKNFMEYGAEQIAHQAENGVPNVVNHMASALPLMPDFSNLIGLSIPHWETPGATGVVC